MGIVEMMNAYASQMAADHEIEEAAGVWKAAEWLAEHWTEIIREVMDMDFNDPRMVAAMDGYQPQLVSGAVGIDVLRHAAPTLSASSISVDGLVSKSRSYGEINPDELKRGLSYLIRKVHEEGVVDD